MSGDPIRHPIEAGIVPVVYAIYTLRKLMPCWSCEGHYKDNGFELGKVPQVWFYSRSVLYPRLISEHLTSLQFKKEIFYQWHVRLTFSASNLDTGFSIEPYLQSDQSLKLDYLQKDSQVIGLSLREGVRHLATQYLRTLERNKKPVR